MNTEAIGIGNYSRFDIVSIHLRSSCSFIDGFRHKLVTNLGGGKARRGCIRKIELLKLGEERIHREVVQEATQRRR